MGGAKAEGWPMGKKNNIYDFLPPPSGTSRTLRSAAIAVRPKGPEFGATALHANMDLTIN